LAEALADVGGSDASSDAEWAGEVYHQHKLAATVKPKRRQGAKA
jgi:hypothetical protein